MHPLHRREGAGALAGQFCAIADHVPGRWRGSFAVESAAAQWHGDHRAAALGGGTGLFGGYASLYNPEQDCYVHVTSLWTHTVEVLLSDFPGTFEQ